MLPSEKKRIEEVIRRITRMRECAPDSLDSIELFLELQEEFGNEAVDWAYRFLEAKRTAEVPRRSPGERDPLWDRDLDG